MDPSWVFHISHRDLNHLDLDFFPRWLSPRGEENSAVFHPFVPRNFWPKCDITNPKGSMYIGNIYQAISPGMWPFFTVHVGKYYIHGFYGNVTQQNSQSFVIHVCESPFFKSKVVPISASRSPASCHFPLSTSYPR